MATANDVDAANTPIDDNEKRLTELWKRTRPSISMVAPHLFISNIYATLDPGILRSHHITAMVSLMDAQHVKWRSTSIRSIVAADSHRFVPCLDSCTMNVLPLLASICDFIDTQLNKPEVDQQNILIHCKEGVSRSATIAIAYLMRKNRQSLDEVLSQIREKRKVKPNPNFIRQLQVWESVEYRIWQDENHTVPKPEYQTFLDDLAILLKAKGLTGNEPIGIQSL